MKRERFIEEYLTWLRFRMEKLLPAEASAYRMMEIARRQHHFSVNDLVASIKRINSPQSG